MNSARLSSTSRAGRLLPIECLAFAVAICRGLIRQIESTGAVPGDEFQLAGVLYAALPAIDIAAALLLVWAAVHVLLDVRRGGDALDRALGLGVAACALASFFVPTLTGPAILGMLARQGRRDRDALAEARGERERRRDALASALVATAPLELLRWWVGLAILAALGAFAIAVSESFLYTARFAPELFDPAVLPAYRLRLVDLALMFGVGLAAGALLPVLFLRVARRRSGPVSRIMVATRAIAVTATLFSAFAFAFVVGDEILKTGVAFHAAILHLLAYHLWCARMRADLAAADLGLFGGEEPEPRTVWLTLYAAVFLLPIESFPRALRDRVVNSARIAHLMHAAIGLAWLTVFILLSYPELEDFRSRFISLAIVTAVNVFLLAGLSLLFSFAALRRARPGRTYVTAMAGVALFGLVSTFRPLANDVAPVLNEYSRFGFMLKKASLRELIRPENRSGLDPVAEPFPYHGPGEDRLSAVAPELYASERPPIFIVLWDAGRPDRMGVYGNDRPTTPNADRMAREAVVFDRAYSGATATTCGVRHLFTGRYSTRYMLSRAHDPFFLHALRPFGYRRFLITAFGSDFNGVSLDSFMRNGPAPESDGSRFVHLALHPRGLKRERPDSEKTDNVIREWRRIATEEGVAALDGSLTFLHLTGTHFPWWNSNPIRDFGPRPEDRYDGEMVKVDMLTGRAFDTLKELGVWDRAIVILVADHGTGLKEHGRYAGFLPYEEQIRVPFIIKAPGFAPRRIAEPVATIDLAPTLLSLFDPGGENGFHGVSLLDLMSGREEHLKRRALMALCAFEDSYSLLLDGRWKFHFHRRENYDLLFDLADDPHERRNLHDADPARREEAMALMRSFLWDGSKLGFGNPYHYSDWTPPAAAGQH